MAENEISVGVTLALEEAKKNLGILNQTLSEFAGNATKFFGQSSAAWASFTGDLAADAVKEGLHLAAEAAREFYEVFIVDGTKAAAANEEALSQVNAALAANNKFSTEASEGMEQFAEAQELVSKNSKAAILSNASLLESFTELDANGLKRAEKDAIDLAAAMHVDLETAVRTMGKASDDNVNALRRVGIQFHATGDSAKDFAEVQRLIEQRFGGRAQAEMENFNGALARAKNVWEDLTASVGDFIVKNPLVTYGINLATQAFRDMQSYIKGNQDAILELVNGGIIFLLRAFAYTLQVGDGVVRFFKALIDSAVFLAEGAILPAVIAITNFGRGLISIIQLAPGMHGAFADLKQDLHDIGNAAEDELLNSMKKVGQDFTQEGTIGKMGDGLQHFTDQLQVFAQEHKRLTDGMVVQNNAAYKKMSDYEKLSEQEKLARLKETFGTIATLTKSHNAVLFRIGQAAAVAQATVDGIAAVQKALAAAPPPFNFVLAGLVGAAQAANIADIVATAPPAFEGGGVVPGNSLAGDQVLARVNSRELILNQEQQAGLFDFIKNGSPGGGGDIIFQVDTFIGEPSFIDNYIAPALRQAMLKRGVTLPAKGIS